MHEKRCCNLSKICTLQGAYKMIQWSTERGGYYGNQLPGGIWQNAGKGRHDIPDPKGKYTVTKYPAKNEGREICNDGNNRTALPAAGLHPKRFNENHEVKTPPTHTAPGAFRRLPSRVFNIFRCWLLTRVRGNLCVNIKKTAEHYHAPGGLPMNCLLYTSDAADEL